MLIALPAFAQTAGTYSGTQSDGAGIGFTVATDSNGKLAVTGVNFGYNSTCNPGAFTIGGGWGYGPTDHLIRNGKVSWADNDGIFYDKVTATYDSATGSFSGTISSNEMTFVPVTKGGPHKAAFCTDTSKTFTVTLQPPAARATPPASAYHW